MTIQLLLFLAFILGVPAIAGWIWFDNRRKNLSPPPHKWNG